MKTNNLLKIILLGMMWGFVGKVSAQTLPTGFYVEDFYYQKAFMTDLEFDEEGYLYLADRRGLVFIVDSLGNRVKYLIDIEDEVGNWGDHGLLGMELDPEYYTNGYIYLLYCVDRHHLLYEGTADYDENANIFEDAAIGRVTRFTVTNPSNPQAASVDYNSRKVLIGETINAGIPILFETHGIGTLEFGTDGTLIVTSGDGAATATDIGGPINGSHSQQALVDGIITSQEDIGVYRSQSLSSLCGKVLRIDAATGDGLASNPYYDPLDPRSPKSRIWAVGMRNPFSLTVIPNSGSHYPADGQPGVFVVADVGWNTWEELNLVTGPGQNFGWPMYEGMESTSLASLNVENLDAPTPSGCSQDYYYFNQTLQDYIGTTPTTWPDPCNPGLNINGDSVQLFAHRRPAFDWHHISSSIPDEARASIDGEYWSMDDPINPVTGDNFEGDCTIAGEWISGYGFPEDYQDIYLHADHVGYWLKSVEFEVNWDPKEIDDFLLNSGGADYKFTKVKEHPKYDGFFFIDYPRDIRRVRYDMTGNQPPKAVIVQDTSYAPTNTLTVQFDGSTSTDNETAPLTYFWDFGDGGTSTSPTVGHTFIGTGGQESFTVSLTVTDTGGYANTATTLIYLNNTPPVISATSIDALDEYPLYTAIHPDLYATITDAESPLTDIAFSWQLTLYHENHNHPGNFDLNDTTSVTLSPVGCDGQFYYWQVNLAVTDPGGLTAEYSKRIDPACGVPVANQDIGTYIDGEDELIDILANDLILDGANTSSILITQQPMYGTASVVNGQIYYVHNGSNNVYDTLYYTFQDVDGDLSNESFVALQEVSSPSISVNLPADQGVVEGSRVRFEYSITGKTDSVDRVEFNIDGTLIKIDYEMLGFFVIDSVLEGAHVASIRLLNSSGNALAYASASTSLQFEVTCVGEVGFVLREHWNDVFGDSIDALLNHPDYPDNPTSSAYMPKVLGTNQIGDNYGTRIRGYFHPPTTDNYTFRATADEKAVMYISSDSTDDPAKLSLIITVPYAVNGGQYIYASQTSPSIPLEAGKKYYIEFLHKEVEFNDSYEIFYQNSTSSTRLGGAVTSPYVICVETTSTPFPVEFLEFNAELSRQGVELNWVTAFEKNNDFFLIERAGENEVFEAIGMVQSQGDSYSKQRYKSVDPSPRRGVNYYRLKQFDLDGTTDYSNIVEVYLKESPILAFPNPVNNEDFLNVNLKLDMDDEGSIELVDVLGKEVYREEINISKDGTMISIPIHSLVPGTYMLSLKVGSGRYTEQVIINEK